MCKAPVDWLALLTKLWKSAKYAKNYNSEKHEQKIAIKVTTCGKLVHVLVTEKSSLILNHVHANCYFLLTI